MGASVKPHARQPHAPPMDAVRLAAVRTNRSAEISIFLARFLRTTAIFAACPPSPLGLRRMIKLGYEAAALRRSQASYVG